MQTFVININSDKEFIDDGRPKPMEETFKDAGGRRLTRYERAKTNLA